MVLLLPPVLAVEGVMYKSMSNREFSDVLADAAFSIEAIAASWLPGGDNLVAALREASQRIKSSAEYQWDVRAAHRPFPDRVKPHTGNDPV